MKADTLELGLFLTEKYILNDLAQVLHKIINEPFGLQHVLKETKIETKIFFAFSAMFERLDTIRIEEFPAKD